MPFAIYSHHAMPKGANTHGHDTTGILSRCMQNRIDAGGCMIHQGIGIQLSRPGWLGAQWIFHLRTQSFDSPSILIEYHCARRRSAYIDGQNPRSTLFRPHSLPLNDHFHPP
jgi:hypothetical protein